MKLEQALKLAKPYVGTLGKKAGSRPVLKTALVTEKHVIATNSHILIRIAHDEPSVEPYLHHYKKYDETEAFEASHYPKTDRLFPDRDYAKSSGPMDTQEMYEAMENACVAAKMNAEFELEQLKIKNSRVPKHLKLTVEQLKRDAEGAKSARVYLTEDKAEVFDTRHVSETGSFTYNFDEPIPIPEKMAFNPEYLKKAIVSFRSSKEKTIECNFYGPLRPLYLVAGDVEVIILPVRVY